MTLGEIIKEFRESKTPEMSQRDFSKLTGLSNSYISMLEKNENRKNGQPIKPTLETLKVVADVIGISLDGILRKLDDIDIDISESKKPTANEGDELDLKIMSLIHQLPDNLKLSLIDLLQSTVAGVRK